MSARVAPIRVLIVDDHPMLREGVAAVVEAQDDMVLVGQASNGVEGLAVFRSSTPDVTLMDLQMPGMNGVDVIQAIRQESPQARIIVLTNYAGDIQALRALKAGAAGYLLKSTLRTELLDAIRAVHAGRRRVSAAIATEVAEHTIDDMLSPREIEILRRVAVGSTNKEIARHFSISEDTAKAHVKSILAKLHATDRTEAVTIALKRGVFEI